MNRVPLRSEFTNLPRHVNWFPGHMRKAMRTMPLEFKKIDVFIEVRDARIPITSQNTDLIELLPERTKRIVVYNKIDLVPDKAALEKIKKLHAETKIPFMHLSTKENININKLKTFIQQKASPEFKTVGSWLMIGGIPNVGKSTIINSLRKRDSEVNHTKKSGARTGGVPCVTKAVSGFKIITDPPTYLKDTPGIIIPKINQPLDGLKLCACNCIRDGIVEYENVIDYILFELNR